MRPASAPAVEKSKPESITDRDDSLEARYSYDRRGERSTMAFVDCYRDELVEEFFAWRARMAVEGTWSGEGIFDALRRWERTRFGADLDVGSHGLLRFGVSIKLAPEDGGRRVSPSYWSKHPDWLKRRAELEQPLFRTTAEALAAKAARGHEMPHVNQSRRQRDEQLMRAQAQADAVRGEDEGVA